MRSKRDLEEVGVLMNVRRMGWPRWEVLGSGFWGGREGWTICVRAVEFLHGALGVFFTLVNYECYAF